MPGSLQLVVGKGNAPRPKPNWIGAEKFLIAGLRDAAEVAGQF